MNKKEKHNLESAYLQTNYIVQEGQSRIVIRIGEINPALDELLKRFNAERWAYLTAYNPFSESLSDEENLIRQSDLLKQLQEKNFRFLKGYGESGSKDWDAEPSIFIFAIEREVAVDFGRSFEQNAIVIGQIGDAPELVWC